MSTALAIISSSREIAPKRWTGLSLDTPFVSNLPATPVRTTPSLENSYNVAARSSSQTRCSIVDKRKKQTKALKRFIKPCWFYEQGENCPYGAHCTYQHGDIKGKPIDVTTHALNVLKQLQEQLADAYDVQSRDDIKYCHHEVKCCLINILSKGEQPRTKKHTASGWDVVEATPSHTSQEQSRTNTWDLETLKSCDDVVDDSLAARIKKLEISQLELAYMDLLRLKFSRETKMSTQRQGEVRTALKAAESELYSARSTSMFSKIETFKKIAREGAVVVRLDLVANRVVVI